MTNTLRVLQERVAQTKGAMSAMLDKLATEDRDFSAEEKASYDALNAKLTASLTQLTEQQKLQDAERHLAAPATAVPGIAVVHDRASDEPFASLGEQLQAIANVTIKGVTDPRLYGAASGASATSGPDGGFLIRKDFAVDLTGSGIKSGALASRCSETPIGENSDGLEVVYVDETSRATGSRWGGVQVYRKAEADTVTASKPGLGVWARRLEDMMGLAYMTERLLADAGAMQSVFNEAFTDEFAFKLDDEIFRGNGVGQCLGIQSHVYSSTTPGSTVSVAKETAQAADTIVAENIIKMWAAVLPRAKANGVWFINTECTPQLAQMQIGTGASGTLVYMPPGGLSGSPFGTIYGRPVIEIEQASALGDVGDITFADLSFYKLITKGGIKQDTSMHVRFLYNEMAFRWTTRVNGAPKLKTAITPYKGTSGNRLAPFVTLAAR